MDWLIAVYIIGVPVVALLCWLGDGLDSAIAPVALGWPLVIAALVFLPIAGWLGWLDIEDEEAEA